MKVIIAGGRELNPEPVFIDFVVQRSGWRDQMAEVVCGMAIGVDMAGKRWADLHGVTVYPEPVTKEDYAKYGRFHGPKVRNQRMADYADALILIWNGESGGSKDMMRRALAKGLPVYAFDVVKGIGEHVGIAGSIGAGYDSDGFA